MNPIAWDKDALDCLKKLAGKDFKKQKKDIEEKLVWFETVRWIRLGEPDILFKKNSIVYYCVEANE